MDPSKFKLSNVADTCAVWNVLASATVHRACKSARVSFCITGFVEYECLRKPGRANSHRAELQRRLLAETSGGAIRVCSIDVEDLQDVEILESRKRVSKGELSSMAFAHKTRQAFLTDDRKALQLARTFMAGEDLQTTPHLIAWLHFTGRLFDSDQRIIIEEYLQLGRNLQPHLNNAYLEAMRCRLLAGS